MQLVPRLSIKISFFVELFLTIFMILMVFITTYAQKFSDVLNTKVSEHFPTEAFKICICD
jgi:hypothetical protein